MKGPTKYQVKDLIELLVWCSIKWEDHPSGKYIPTWDNSKLHRLETLMQVSAYHRELIEICKHTISFTYHWRIDDHCTECLAAIPTKHRKQAFVAACIVMGARSFESDCQNKFDGLTARLISKTFKLSKEECDPLFEVAMSFHYYTKALSAMEEVNL